MTDITVVITTIPSRKQLLERSFFSVCNQMLEPDNVIVTIDHEGKGAWHNRNHGLFMVDTEWTAFLDDDDELYPSHLKILYDSSDDADLIYPWFDGRHASGTLTMNGRAPEGQLPDMKALDRGNWIPITYLVRTELAQSVGGFPELNSADWPHDNCEDWGFLLRMRDAGARFKHVNKRTWKWHIHNGNTSGRPWK